MKSQPLVDVMIKTLARHDVLVKSKDDNSLEINEFYLTKESRRNRLVTIGTVITLGICARMIRGFFNENQETLLVLFAGIVVLAVALCVAYFVQSYLWKKKAQEARNTILNQNGIEIQLPNGKVRRYDMENFVEFRYRLDLDGSQPKGEIKLIDNKDGVVQIFKLKAFGVQSKHEKAKDLEYDSRKIVEGLQAYFSSNYSMA